MKSLVFASVLLLSSIHSVNSQASTDTQDIEVLLKDFYSQVGEFAKTQDMSLPQTRFALFFGTLNLLSQFFEIAFDARDTAVGKDFHCVADQNPGLAFGAIQSAAKPFKIEFALSESFQKHISELRSHAVNQAHETVRAYLAHFQIGQIFNELDLGYRSSEKVVFNLLTLQATTLIEFYFQEYLKRSAVYASENPLILQSFWLRFYKEHFAALIEPGSWIYIGPLCLLMDKSISNDKEVLFIYALSSNGNLFAMFPRELIAYILNFYLRS